ncbi:HpcH/HpaI aldolase/citrate lyase family protein [Streptomyces sp. NPDC091377]|uniref:HpcH/HpaI aldolase family protein n=1 Tax=Streptomyces sp. NPDC091377 TaxID=3365995 RepID=UPI003812E46C
MTTTPPPAPGFLQRLHSGEPTLMLTLRTARTADVVHIAASSGHHSVMVDLEHSTMSTDTAAHLCAVAGGLGLTALVRVPEREYGMIGRLLDGGAHGVIAPRIETAEEARRIVGACRFPPRGQRSQTNMLPQLGMRPTPAARMNPAIDATTVVQILLETPEGVANADAIAALDGVDMLALGANDFTAELGVPGRYDDPRVRQAVWELAEACRRHGKLMVLGGIGDQKLMADLVPLGVCPLRITGTDTAFLFEAATVHAGRALDALRPPTSSLS